MNRIGTPDEIYNHPKTSYVATFVGNANILKGTAETTEGEYFRASVAGVSLLVRREGQKVAVGEPVTVAVRSENIHLDEDPARGLEGRSPGEEFCRRDASGCIETERRNRDHCQPSWNRCQCRARADRWLFFCSGRWHTG